MSRCFSKCRMFTWFLLVLLLLLSAYSLAAQDTATAEPDTIIEVTSEPFEMTFGSGAFNLLLPTVGLADLASYRATLTVSFEGTNAGQNEQWSRTYTLLVMQTPPARRLTIENSEDDPQVYMAEINGIFYERRDGSVCGASPITAEDAFAERWELAGFLDSVIGADEAGSETVNDVAADHYSFDQSARGMSEIIDSTGELWVASNGGYLVRYTLTTTADAAYFGEGIEGTQTWDYQLSDVNQPLVIEIPEDCPPALLDVPTMPDAADVVQMPGFTIFTTSSSLEDVVAFYEEQVTAMGGQPAYPPVISETTVLFGFTQGDLPILLMASNDGADTSVQIQALNDPSELAFAEEVPDRAGQTVANNPSGECAAAGLPMLPDATNVQDMFGNISYDTNTNIVDAVAFYEEQLATLGGQVSSPMPATDQSAMLNLTSSEQVVSIMFSAEGGVTNVSITSISMNQSGPPPADCNVTEPATTNTAEPNTTSAQCEPSDILILPDAANVQNMSGVIMYTTSASVEEAVAFYEEQVVALGGQVSSPMPASDALAMLDVRQGALSLLITITSMGGVNNVTITSATGSPLPSPSDCVVSE